MKRSNFCFIVGKLRFILCAVFILLCSCQKETNTLNENNDDKFLVGLIPSTALCGWDYGYQIKEDYYLVYKEMTDAGKECVIGYMASMDSLQSGEILFEADKNYKLTKIIDDSVFYFFSYEHDSVSLIILNSDGEKSYDKVFNINDVKIDFLPNTKVSTKSVADDISLICELLGNISFFMNEYDDISKHDWTSALGTLAQMIMDERVIKPIIKFFSKRLLLPITVIQTLREAPETVHTLYNTIVGWPYFGPANTRISSFSNKTLNVEIVNSGYMPEIEPRLTVNCRVVVKYTGFYRDNNSVGINEGVFYQNEFKIQPHDTSVSFNLPALKLGFYTATSYLRCGDVYREGTTVIYCCDILERLPQYSIDEYSFNSTGTGKLSLTLSASMKPDDFFPNLNIHLSGNSHVLFLSADDNIYKETVTINLNIEDSELDIDNKKASFIFNANYSLWPSDDFGPRFYDLNPTTLTYSEQPSIRFESVKIDRTEKRTEKKNNVITRRGSSPDVPDEEEITYYTTYFTATYSMEGSFWIRDIYNVKYGTTHVTDLTNVKPQKTGTYKFQGAIEYNSDSPLWKEATIYCNMNLIDGSSITSSNTLYFYGEEEITTANCKDF